jgi:hypothetical protein
MTDLFLERKFEPAITPAEVMEMVTQSVDCFGMHRVEWINSYLSIDGRRMFCWFRAPDMESARIALRQADADISVFWSGGVHDKPGLDADDIATANVLVQRSFDEGTSLQTIQDIEDAGIRCLEVRNVSFKRTFHSVDRKRMICLYHSPDAESVRVAQREAGVPVEDVWPFISVNSPDRRS